MSFNDYGNVITKCLVSNNKNFSQIRKIQGNKLHNLFLNPQLNRAIFNFSGQVLNAPEKSLLNFTIPPKNINNAN